MFEYFREQPYDVFFLSRHHRSGPLFILSSRTVDEVSDHEAQKRETRNILSDVDE